MPSTLKTPGVYIEEINAFPGSAVAVDTALPVFIGYTEKADRKGKSLIGVPTRVTSFAEYVELFGQGFNHRFNITKSGAAAPPDKKAAADAKAPAASTGDQFKINGENYNITIKNSFYFYNSIRLFYQNGGSNCYIMAIGTYGNNPAAEVKLEDFNESVFKTLEKEFEPTLVVMPDIVSKGSACYSKYLDVLKHCNQTQSRFGIFDVVMEADTPEGDILKFRTEIGTSFLNYGAAYYPWLKTSVVASSELSFENLDAAVKLGDLLPEADAKSVLDKMKELADEKKI